MSESRCLEGAPWYWLAFERRMAGRFGGGSHSTHVRFIALFREVADRLPQVSEGSGCCVDLVNTVSQVRLAVGLKGCHGL